MQKRTLGQLAKHVGGKVIGDDSLIITSAATLEKAGENDISFLANQKYSKQLGTTKAGAVIVEKQIDCPSSLLIAADPYYAFREIMVLIYGQRKHQKTGISKKASISETAKIGKDCHIGDFATISENVTVGDGTVIYPGVFIGPDTQIGKDCILYANAVVYDECVLGDRVIVQANATVGEDGFGFATHRGMHYKIPHIGRAILEDDVEIGSGSGIERGTLDDTVIGAGTKIGDQVAVGHGTKIGKGCLIVAQAGIAGSTTIGNYCVLGGQVGIVGHIKIGNMVTIAAQAGVINDVPDGQTIVGAPAIDAQKAKRAYALIETLPDMRKSLKKLQRDSQRND